MDPLPQQNAPSAENLENELSPEWNELISRIRNLANEALDNPSADSSLLASESLRLCRHLERLHSGVEEYLDTFSQDDSNAGRTELPDGSHPTPNRQEKNEALEIRREIHNEFSVRSAIKALFLWEDHVDDRLDKEKTKRVE